MKLKKQRYSGTQIGSTFLLVILIVLCLVIFATLSLSGALRDLEFSKKVAEQTSAYYEANTEAYNLLEQVDECLMNSSLPEAGEDYLTRVRSELISNLPGVTVTEGEDSLTVTYLVPINDAQSLQVSLEIPGERGEERYIIRSWRESNSAEWVPDDGLSVFDINLS